MKFLLLPLLLATSLYADEAAPAQGGGYLQTLIIIGIAVVFFYFLLLRPEQKRRKAMEKMRSSMKKGDKVTAMGIIGTIFQVKDNTVVLKMVDGAKIEVLKAAISEVQAGTEVEEKGSEKNSGCSCE
ncbi:MAG: preprotein translocase subunit YajC [Chlamydiae bacterium]|nr:preprotein translocase subunit YajC [Chlamydiota bacterium]